MSEFFKKYSAILVLGAVLVVGSYAVGYQKGGNITPSIANSEVTGEDDGRPLEVDFSVFWKAWNIINEKYVPASTTREVVSDQEKIWGAIEGLASALGDPYTVFFPPVESELFEADIRGNFEGIGAEILAEEGAITVVAPLKDSPAERAGLISGDRIIKIDDKNTNSMTTEDAVKIIRGPKGEVVTLTVFREGVTEPFNVDVVRDTINIPTLATEELDNGIFLIELYSFTAESPNLFRESLRKFIQSGNGKLILDLRGNPGGYLEAAIDMASWFLPPSKVVVKEDFGKGGNERVYRSKGYDIFNNNFKFVILVDGGSASASEILAGALQEHGEAVVVGAQTFGKGSVQELVNITSNTSLKVTVARWLTPKGNSISEGGITPDYIVNYTLEDREAGRDPQLEKAKEVLLN